MVRVIKNKRELKREQYCEHFQQFLCFGCWKKLHTSARLDKAAILDIELGKLQEIATIIYLNREEKYCKEMVP